ncbi:MAG: tyrosine-type recombinase/integrase [Methylococcaceae bacterium]
MLIDIVNIYLSVRRDAGFKLDEVEKYLSSYANFAMARGDTHIAGKTAIEWASQASSENERSRRSDVLIRFARFARAEDGRNEIPPDGVFYGRWHRRTPYIYTDEEVQKLIVYAEQLKPIGTLRPHTYSTLFGLLATTGIRISEALSLRFNDVTPEGLVIRKTKFKKSRLLPLHDSTIEAINRYQQCRRQFATADDHVFISLRGKKLGCGYVAKTFKNVLMAAGIQGQPNGPKPRLHDFRHRFAVKSLESCHDTGDRFARHMLALGTYMGHVHPKSTYWYLQSTPLLMRGIADKCESFITGDQP